LLLVVVEAGGAGRLGGGAGARVLVVLEAWRRRGLELWEGEGKGEEGRFL
jgi:hypothetical protein